MKNKMRIKFGVLIATIIALAIIGTIGVKKMTEPTEKERQIAFLKEHEEEMTEYVKQQNEKIAKVAFCWESLEQESVGNVFHKEQEIFYLSEYKLLIIITIK